MRQERAGEEGTGSYSLSLFSALRPCLLTAAAEHEIRSPSPSGAVTFRMDRKREARRIPSPRFGTRTRNLFAQRQVAYGAMLISVRVSGLVLPPPARYATAAAAVHRLETSFPPPPFLPHPATSSLALFSRRTLMRPTASPSLFPFPGALIRFFLCSGDFLDRWRFKQARERAGLSENPRVFVRRRRTKSLAPFDG